MCIGIAQTTAAIHIDSPRRRRFGPRIKIPKTNTHRIEWTTLAITNNNNDDSAAQRNKWNERTEDESKHVREHMRNTVLNDVIHRVVPFALTQYARIQVIVASLSFPNGTHLPNQTPRNVHPDIHPHTRTHTHAKQRSVAPPFSNSIIAIRIGHAVKVGIWCVRVCVCRRFEWWDNFLVDYWNIFVYYVIYHTQYSMRLLS